VGFADAVFIRLFDPYWVWEFHQKVKEMVYRAGSSEVYEESQDSLLVLESTGKGNCVAWSKLMAKIAMHRKVFFRTYVMCKNCKPRDGLDMAYHQITVLTDDTGQLWLQSNAFLMRVASYEEALFRAGWQIEPTWIGTFKIDREEQIYQEDLYK
jgi:hypothetical protein